MLTLAVEQRRNKHRIFTRAIAVLMLVCLWMAIATLTAFPKTNSPTKAPVILGSQTLFYVHEGVGAFSVQERADAISDRIETLADNTTVEPSSITVETSESAVEIVAGDITLLAITAADAKGAGRSQQSLAQTHRQKIVAGIQQYRNNFTTGNILTVVASLIAATGVLIAVMLALNRLLPLATKRLEAWRVAHSSRLSVENVELLPITRLTWGLIGFLKLLRWAVLLVALYVYTTFVLSLFPWTARLADELTQDFLVGLKEVGNGFWAALPDLLIIVLAVVISYNLIRFVQFVFGALERGSLTVPGFYPEWAPTTFKLVALFIIAFTLALIFPLLPGYDSPAFKGVSVFFGLLVSLGSAGAVANVLSGILLTYSRAFRVGDRIKIADSTGDVVEKSLLVTRIRTIKNEVITFTNAQVLGGNITNYSAAARDHDAPLILHTTITLGYDAPLPEIHQALTAAALATPNILKEPPPFVLQTSLDDFYVSYQLNAFTDQPNRMALIYSDLYKNILVKCDAAGIEILSPHYHAVRDGNESTLTTLPPDYTPPGLRIHQTNNHSA